jgi:hypothetical protein
MSYIIFNTYIMLNTFKILDWCFTLLQFHMNKYAILIILKNEKNSNIDNIGMKKLINYNGQQILFLFSWKCQN